MRYHEDPSVQHVGTTGPRNEYTPFPAGADPFAPKEITLAPETVK